MMDLLLEETCVHLNKYASLATLMARQSIWLPCQSIESQGTGNTAITSVLVMVKLLLNHISTTEASKDGPSICDEACIR